VLRAARRLLRPGGVVYVGATHAASLGLGFAGAHHPALATHERLNLFTAGALETLAARHGFAVRSLTTDDDLDVSFADWAQARLPRATAIGRAVDRAAGAASRRWHLASRKQRGGTIELVATKSPSC
jgi:hypothetical protein